MPRGIYIKIDSNSISKGDIIIFNSPPLKRKLIKYVLATSGAEFCFDEEGTLWVNNIPHAQRNIEKYFPSDNGQSFCRDLKSDQILIIGDHPQSYDSRYFGPIIKDDIIATVKLFFAFNDRKD